jgi:hypothetical protein
MELRWLVTTYKAPGKEAAKNPRRLPLEYTSANCRLVLEQPGPSVIVVRISGSDVGEFGEGPMLALDSWLAEAGNIELFIDARKVRGASIDVSAEWAKWLDKNRTSLRTITMLTGSHFVHLTAEFVRRFHSLQGIMRICTEPSVFDHALAETLNFH